MGWLIVYIATLRSSLLSLPCPPYLLRVGNKSDGTLDAREGALHHHRSLVEDRYHTILANFLNLLHVVRNELCPLVSPNLLVMPQGQVNCPARFEPLFEELLDSRKLPDDIVLVIDCSTAPYNAVNNLPSEGGLDPFSGGGDDVDVGA